MKKIRKYIASALMVSLLMFSLASCGKAEEDSLTSENSDDIIVSGKVDVKYTSRDLDGTWDESKATRVELSEKSYTIKEAGVYVFSGTLKDGQIIVDAGDTDKVQIVLAGVNIKCADGPAILVKNADKTFITLAEGSENTIADGKTYASTEDQPWGAIFSRDNLTINGSGKLIVKGNHMHGIVSKDDLKVTGGEMEVTAVKDGLRGKDSVRIYDGKITISAKGNGIKSNNEKDEDKGFISIDGGEIDIKDVSSQGIEAYQVAQMTGGILNIDSSNEGIQAKIVYIKDGTMTINATDDCLNATDSQQTGSESAQDGVSLEIAGGTLNLSTTAGDGLDSNGDLTVSGGTTILQGSSGGVEVNLDYNGEGLISGGTVIGVGNAQMAQNFGENSTQGSILYGGSSYKAGTTVTLTDADGKELASIKADRSFSCVLVSAPGMKKGETYTLKIGDDSKEIELSTIVVNEGTSGQMGGGGPGQGGGPGGGMNGAPGEMPEGGPPGKPNE